MFGLVKSHEFLFFFLFRLIRVVVKKSKRKIISSFNNNKLLKKYTLATVFDACSASSLFLILFKLFFRIIGFNPLWQLNLVVLLVGIIIALKFNLIQFIRKFFVIFWRKTLGERFFTNYFELDFWDLVSYEEKFERLEPETKINKIFQNIHYFFIGLRLFILNEPWSFILFNFFLTYFLIFNKFFLFSSFFSLLLISSKFTFFLFDHSPKELRTLLLNFVELEENESLELNMENIKFLSIFTTRFLQKEVYDRYLVETLKKGEDGKAIFDEKIHQRTFLNNKLRERDVFRKQLYAFIYYSNYDFREDMTQKEIDGCFYDMRGSMMFVEGRKDILGDFKEGIERRKGDQEETAKVKQGRDAEYKKAEEISQNFVKKQKINAYFYPFLNLSLFLVLSYFIQSIPIDHFVQTTIITRFLKEDVISIIRVPANKMPGYRQRYLNNQEPLSPKSDCHDYLIVFTKYGQYLHTLTTIKDPDTPDLGKKVINEPYGIATTGTFIEQHLTNAEILKIQEEFGTVNKKLLETLETSEVIYIVPNYVKEIKSLLQHDNQKLDFFYETFNRIYLPNHMQIQHILLRDFRVSSLGITGTQSIHDLRRHNYYLKDYYGNQKYHLNSNYFQKKFASQSLEILTKFETNILPIFKHLDLPKEDNIEFYQKDEILKDIVTATSKNQNKPYTLTETKTLSQLLNKPVDVIKNDYSNLQNVSKNHGGKPLKIKGNIPPDDI